MAGSKLVRNILDNMNKTITELRYKGMLRDEQGISEICRGKNLFEISYSSKNDVGSIIFDKHISSTRIIDTLLSGHQYNILLYDKGFVQAEFIVKDEEVIKERLVFMKKHNKIWDVREIEEYEIADEDWFAEEEGVPIVLRIDYAPDDHKDCEHAATHLTISNHESCRIPMKGVVTFSEFVRFILLHFYDIELELPICRFDSNDTITVLEKKMIHMSWE